MKNHRTTMLCVCITLFSLCTYAQNQTISVTQQDNNSSLPFSNLPDLIPANIADLNTLLNAPVGQSVKINPGSDFRLTLEGQVVSISSKFENTVQSVVIRSTNFPGTRLTFSKISSPDGTLSYAGRILNIQNADLFELQNQNGQFVLIKKKLNDFVND
jgi:hypothetical protein